MIKISVAILSCNRCNELKQTLAELFKSPDIWHEIIVADNASKDGAPEMVQSEYPEVKLINTGGNRGIVGSNLAYQAATGDWVLSLDDDSVPDIDSLKYLRSTGVTDDPIAAIALSVRRKSIRSRLQQSSTLSDAYGFSSAGVLINRHAIADIGVYDPELFLFTNELHWTARAFLKKWRLAKADHLFVIHRSSPQNRSNARHAYLYTRNMLLFLLRYAPKALIQPLATRYFQWVLAYSILHRTVIYIQAVRQAIWVHHRSPEKRCPLDEQTLTRINPDWRAGFSHLG